MGTYVANTTVPENNLFLSQNLFWYSVGQTKMKAFRAYFELADVLAEVENASARIAMSFNDDTTGISTMQDSDNRMHGEVYDLQGRRVATPAHGLYIILPWPLCSRRHCLQQTQGVYGRKTPP